MRVRNSLVDRLSRFNHVDERRFHAGTARRRDRNRYPVLSFKDIAQQRLHVVHATQKERIEMSEHWRGHGREDAVIDRARPRAEQQALGRLESFVDALFSER